MPELSEGLNEWIERQRNKENGHLEDEKEMRHHTNLILFFVRGKGKGLYQQEISSSIDYLVNTHGITEKELEHSLTSYYFKYCYKYYKFKDWKPATYVIHCTNNCLKKRVKWAKEKKLNV